MWDSSGTNPFLKGAFIPESPTSQEPGEYPDSPTLTMLPSEKKGTNHAAEPRVIPREAAHYHEKRIPMSPFMYHIPSMSSVTKLGRTSPLDSNPAHPAPRLTPILTLIRDKQLLTQDRLFLKCLSYNIASHRSYALSFPSSP